MKKLFKGLMSVLCVLTIFLFAGCGETTSDDVVDTHYEYFDVVEMINAGDYESAKARIDEVYGNETDYSDVKGHNKALLMRLYYERQGMYDEAMDEILKVIQDSNITSEDIDNQVYIKIAKDLLDKVSEETKTKALNVLNGSGVVVIDFENTLITDATYLNWYVKEFNVELVSMNEFEKLREKAEDLKKNLSEDTLYNVSVERELFKEDYWKITNNKFDYDGVYTGELSDNMPNGFGVLYDVSGFVKYMGEFKDGRFHGLGMQYHIPEDLDYDSIVYQYGEENAKVIRERINYCEYIGEFKNGLQHGKGNLLSYPSLTEEESYKEESGNPYVHITILTGDFKENAPDGKYKVYAKGYLRMDMDATSDGTGTAKIYFLESTQLEYDGEIKNNRYHGKGTLYDESGKVIYSGEWKNGDYK